MFLVGGFSCCLLLQRAVRDVLHSDGCSVEVAHRPDVAIVKGAVLFQKNFATFASRKARFTYGVDCSDMYDNSDLEHRRRRDAGHVYTNDEGDTCISNVFSKHVIIGQDIPSSGVFAMQTYGCDSETSTTLRFTIFVSNKRNPRFIDEEGCIIVGQGSTPVDRTVPLRDRGARIQFTYLGTEMLVAFFHPTEDKELEVGLSFVSH